MALTERDDIFNAQGTFRKRIGGMNAEMDEVSVRHKAMMSKSDLEGIRNSHHNI